MSWEGSHWTFLARSDVLMCSGTLIEGFLRDKDNDDPAVCVSHMVGTYAENSMITGYLRDLLSRLHTGR